MRNETFIRGMDLSMLQHIQDRGVQYRDDWVVKEPLALFQKHGINFVRLRLFVSPAGRDGQVNTQAKTLALARRVKQAGLRLLLDFHYSDEWADPLHQTIPAEWSALTSPELVTRVFAYTQETMAAFAREDCLPDMVQVGNEITNGMIWPVGGPFLDAAGWNDISSEMSWPDQEKAVEAQWGVFIELLKAGIRGVRASDPAGDIQIMVHVDKGGNTSLCRHFFDTLQRRGVEYDVIGLSYYPFWHGSLSDLTANLASLAGTYEKPIVVVETGYDWNGGEQGSLPFPLTPGGQHAFLKTLLQTVAATPGGLGHGVFYWAPEWISGTHWEGPSWSPIWENRALFDHSGNALPALSAFAVPIEGCSQP